MPGPKRAEELGAGEILLTSMDRDGTKEGYDLDITRQISGSVSIPVIASGGAGCLKDFYDAIVIGGADAVLAASLFHFGEISIPQLKRYLHLRGLPVRLSPEEQALLSSGRPFSQAASFQKPDILPRLWQKLKTGREGLLLVIACDCEDGTVLMQAYMDEEALSETVRTGLMHYHSRSRGKLWLKGERSGNFQRVVRLFADCDADCLLAEVQPYGPACHTGSRSCFYRPLDALIEADAKEAEGDSHESD